MTLSNEIKSLIIFLFYNIHKLPYSHLRETIESIDYESQLHSITKEDDFILKNYLIHLIFYIRNKHYGGKNKRKISHDLLFILYDYYPQDILNIIELFIYYGSFKDLNTLILVSSHDQKYAKIKEKCYDIYIKYLIIDYYKIKYFMEYKGNSVYISDCVKYIPKENKNVDKQTNATHDIVKKLFPSLYSTNKHSALKLFRKIYRPIVSFIQTAEKTTSNNKDMFNYIQFTFITNDNIDIENLSAVHRNMPCLHKRHLLSKNYMSMYRTYIIDYLWFTYNFKYNFKYNYCNKNNSIYEAKKFDNDNIKHILYYYSSNSKYFWNVLTSTFNDDCYASVYNRLI